MKKIALCIFTFLILENSIFCYSSRTHETSSPLVIQGGYKEVLNINITPVASQSESYLVGMPFNIEDPSVLSTESSTTRAMTWNGSGRMIANWTFISNTNFDMSIEMFPMRHVDTPNSGIALWYALGLSFNLSYYDGSILKNVEGYFTANPPSTVTDTDVSCKALMRIFIPPDKLYPEGEPGETISLVDTGYFANDVIKDGLIGSSEGMVLFSFDVPTSNRIQATTNNEVKSGNYAGSIKITLIPKDIS